MRLPSQYIADAVRNIRNRMIPDCACVLTHGETKAKVIRVGTSQLGEDAVTESSPVETVRVLAVANDLSDVCKGALVFLGGVRHIVTSIRVDPIGASMTVGLSSPLGEYVIDYRRPGSRIRQSLYVVAVESETLSAQGESLAPTTSRSWFVAFSAEDWIEKTDPQVGDEIRIDGEILRVANVAKHDGNFVLTCRSRRQ